MRERWVVVSNRLAGLAQFDFEFQIGYRRVNSLFARSLMPMPMAAIDAQGGRS